MREAVHRRAVTGHYIAQLRGTWANWVGKKPPVGPIEATLAGLSPAQRLVDLGFGIMVLLALGGWFITPALGVIGIFGVIITRLLSRSMGAKMPSMQSWISSKTSTVPVLVRFLETAYSAPVRSGHANASAAA